DARERRPRGIGQIHLLPQEARRGHGAEMRAPHPERSEDVLPGEAVERLAGDALDELPEHLVSDVGVAEPGARWGLERLAVLALEDLGPRAGVELDRVVRRQSGAVRQELLDRDL